MANKTLEKERKALLKMQKSLLMKHLIQEVHEEGVIGEEDSIIILALKISLRLVKNADATSSNILVSDDTGGGKDFLVKAITKVLLVPEITCYHRTNISRKTFDYWQPTLPDSKEPVSWDGKVLYLEDPEEDVIKGQSFKVMASGGTAITVIKDQEVFNKKIEGKPVIIVTSMKAAIDIEGERRWDCIRLDLSTELTNKVKDRVALKAAGLIPYKPDVGFRSLLQSLLKYRVVVPFAQEIVKGLSSHLNMRTQILKLLDYVKASAVLHQYDRKKDDKKQIIATPEDFELARLAFLHLRNEEALALTKKEQELVDFLRDKGEHMKIRDIINELEGYTKDWIHRHKESLIERKVMSIVMDFDADAGRNIEHLKYVGIRVTKNKMLPAYKLLKCDGYISTGEFYSDINKKRKKMKLLPLFEGIKNERRVQRASKK